MEKSQVIHDLINARIWKRGSSRLDRVDVQVVARWERPDWERYEDFCRQSKMHEMPAHGAPCE